MTRNKKVPSGCPNASNRFHSCSEYCVHGDSTRSIDTAAGSSVDGSSATREELGGGRRNSGSRVSPSRGDDLDGSKQKGVNAVNKKVNNSGGLNAYNIFRDCSVYGSVVQPKQGKATTASGGLIEGKRKNVKPGSECVNASNPFHNCSEYCSHTRKNNGATY